MSAADYAALVPAVAAVLLALAAYIRAAALHAAVREHLAHHPGKAVQIVRQSRSQMRGDKV